MINPENYSGQAEEWHENWLDNHAACRRDYDHLTAMSPIDWLDYMDRNGQKAMDEVVEGEVFPAYRIVKWLKANRRLPTERQREAITNVYLWTEYHLRIEEC